MNSDSVWLWCPCCERAFKSATPDGWNARQKDRPGEMGFSDPLPTPCPFADCRADGRLIISWEALRAWAEKVSGVTLPERPRQGHQYKLPLGVAARVDFGLRSRSDKGGKAGVPQSADQGTPASCPKPSDPTAATQTNNTMMKRMKAKVDRKLCNGNGNCMNICPGVFKVSGGKACLACDLVPKKDEPACRQAVQACPTHAISIEMVNEESSG